MLIQQANWLTRARKAAGAKGPAQADLLEDISQYLLVANLDTPEYDLLGGVRNFSFTFEQIAVAAQFSFGSIFNPVGSGILAYVYRIAASVGVAGAWFERRLTNDTAGGQVTQRTIDTRIDLNTPGVLICRIGSNGAMPGDPVPYNVGASGAGLQDEYIRSYVLAPGNGLVIAGGVVNNLMRGSMWFKERPAESGELAFGIS